MRKIFFDIETSNIFADVGKNDPSLLDLAVVVIYDSESDKYSCFEQSELTALWPLMEKADLLIGFNSDHFDIPLLDKYYPGNLSAIKSVDIMKEIKNVLGRRVGLGHVARVTLGTGKNGHGLDAIEWWKKGLKDKVKEYCFQDVKVTKELYDFALKNGYVQIEDGTNKIKIQLDKSGWEKRNNSAMTQTIPFY